MGSDEQHPHGRRAGSRVEGMHGRGDQKVGAPCSDLFAFSNHSCNPANSTANTNETSMGNMNFGGRRVCANILVLKYFYVFFVQFYPITCSQLSRVK
jgi:hypothetical protein